MFFLLKTSRAQKFDDKLCDKQSSKIESGMYIT